MKDLSQVDRNFEIPAYVEKPDLCYYDVKTAPFAVYGVFYEDGYFRRIPETVAKAVSDGVTYLHTNTSGGRIRFVTDSPYVAIHAVLDGINAMPHVSLSGSCGLDLYADGAYYGAFVPPVDMTDGYDHILEFQDRKLREILIHMPLYCNVKELLVGLSETAQVLPAALYRFPAPVVYYGHSITQGGCASGAGNSYPNILSRRLGVDQINLGFSGSCKGEQAMAAHIAGLSMRALVMDYDHNAPDIDHLRKTHEPFFKTVRQAQPDLPVIFLTATAQERCFDDRDGRKAVIRQTYENALAAGDKNVYFIDGSRIYDGVDAATTVEGCHANDLGFLLQANAVGAVLSDVLKASLSSGLRAALRAGGLCTPACGRV